MSVQFLYLFIRVLEIQKSSDSLHILGHFFFTRDLSLSAIRYPDLFKYFLIKSFLLSRHANRESTPNNIDITLHDRYKKKKTKEKVLFYCLILFWNIFWIKPDNPQIFYLVSPFLEIYEMNTKITTYWEHNNKVG